MSKAKLIPAPKVPLLNVKWDLNPLREKMATTHTEKRFSSFTECVRNKMTELGLLGYSFREISEADWKELIERITMCHPEIHDYQDCWPIREYLNWRARRGMRPVRHKPSKSEDSDDHKGRSMDGTHSRNRARASSPDPVDLPRPRHQKPSLYMQKTALSRKERWYVGKPPAVHSCSVRAAGDPARKSVKKCAQSAENARPRPLAPEKPAEVTVGQMTQQPQPLVPPVEYTPPAAFHRTPRQIQIACPRCDFTAVPINQSMPVLHSLVSNPSHIAALRDVGLATDAHLRLVLGWSREARKELFEALDPAKMRPWDKMMILNSLADVGVSALFRDPDEARTSNVNQQQYDQCPTPSHGNLEHINPGPLERTEHGGPPEPCQPPHHSIPQPGPEEEERATNPDMRYDELRKLMRLEESIQTFHSILTYMIRSPTHINLLQQYWIMPGQFEDAVKTIAQGRLLFERYDNYWPVRFFLKRRIRKVGNHVVDTHLNYLPSSSIQPHSVSDSAECPWTPASGRQYQGLKPCEVDKRTAVPNPGDKAYDLSPKSPAEPRSATGATEFRIPHYKLCIKHAHAPLPTVAAACPVHPDIDTSALAPSLHRLLIHIGLPEFIAAFTLIGVQTQTQFLHFCTLPEADKLELFGDRRVVKGCAFWNCVLKWEFTQQRVLEYALLLDLHVPASQ